jgi:hypothetical protein
MTTTTPTTDEINAMLKRYPKARTVAVHNFVSSCPLDGPLAAYNAIQNLYMDASLYKWNIPTLICIRKLLNL